MSLEQRGDALPEISLPYSGHSLADNLRGKIPLVMAGILITTALVVSCASPAQKAEIAVTQVPLVPTAAQTAESTPTPGYKLVFPDPDATSTPEPTKPAPTATETPAPATATRVATAEPTKEPTKETINLLKDLEIYQIYRGSLTDTNGKSVGEILIARFPKNKWGKDTVYVNTYTTQFCKDGGKPTPRFTLSERNLQGDSLQQDDKQLKISIKTNDISTLNGEFIFKNVVRAGANCWNKDLSSTFEAKPKGKGLEVLIAEYMAMDEKLGVGIASTRRQNAIKGLENIFGGPLPEDPEATSMQQNKFARISHSERYADNGYLKPRYAPTKLGI